MVVRFMVCQHTALTEGPQEEQRPISGSVHVTQRPVVRRIPCRVTPIDGVVRQNIEDVGIGAIDRHLDPCESCVARAVDEVRIAARRPPFRLEDAIRGRPRADEHAGDCHSAVWHSGSRHLLIELPERERRVLVAAHDRAEIRVDARFGAIVRQKLVHRVVVVEDDEETGDYRETEESGAGDRQRNPDQPPNLSAPQSKPQ